MAATMLHRVNSSALAGRLTSWRDAPKGCRCLRSGLVSGRSTSHGRLPPAAAGVADPPPHAPQPHLQPAPAAAAGQQLHSRAQGAVPPVPSAAALDSLPFYRWVLQRPSGNVAAGWSRSREYDAGAPPGGGTGGEVETSMLTLVQKVGAVRAAEGGALFVVWLVSCALPIARQSLPGPLPPLAGLFPWG